MSDEPLYSQQRAEDVYQLHCYLYYVHAKPIMSDLEFDWMHAYFRKLYPQSTVLNTVGSDNPDHYPAHVKEGRRPRAWERRK